MGSSQTNESGVAGKILAILFAAVVLGVAYNSASPLGVRHVESTPKSASAARASGDDGMIYQNETTALRLEEATASPVLSSTNSLAAGGNVSTLGWPDVKPLLAQNRIVLVDARKTVHFELDHIPGAISLPADSSPDSLASFATKYPPHTALVIYCGSISCPMAHQLATVLIGRFGYSNVREMPGGFAEYRQSESQPGPGGSK